MMNIVSYQLRSYTPEDIEQLIDIQRECFPPPFPQDLLWQPEQLLSHIRYFSEGALCIEAEPGLLVASSTAMMIQWDLKSPDHSWAETTGDGFIHTHNPKGNTLYGVDIAVRPSWQKRGLARMMYQKRFEIVREKKLQRFLSGGRLANYAEYKDRLSPEEYIKGVFAGTIIDETLTAMMKAGLKPVKVVRHYLPLPDPEADHCALLLEWANPDL
jgi:ribosomal protein S18 acetylase RimI-like enzyme